jgi:photosystem II stability/assembly factor-like uncharacterized protein
MAALGQFAACENDVVRVDPADVAGPITAFDWYTPRPTPHRLRGIAPAANAFVTVGDYGTIARSDDAGMTWKTQALNQFQNTLAGVHFLDALTGMAVGSNGLVARTDDGGVTWTRQATGINNSLYDVYMLDSSTAVVVGIGAIICTSDGGASWTPSTVPVPLGVSLIADVAFFDATRGVATFSTSGSFEWLVTEDAGKSWTLKVSAACTKQLHRLWFTGESVGYAVSWLRDGSCASLFHTSDAGESWQARGPVSARWNDILFLDEMRGFAVDDNRVDETVDGGVTWTLSADFPIRRLHRLARSGNVIIAVGEEGRIVRSDDTGQTWVLQTGSPDGWPSSGRISFERMSGAGRWIFSTGRELLVTDNRGTTWERRLLPGFTTYVDFFDDDRGMTGFSHWRTRNAGRTWSPIARPANPDQDFTAFDEIAGGDIIAVGGDIYDTTAPAIIRRSSDFGDSWEALYDSPVVSNLFYDVAFADARRRSARRGNGSRGRFRRDMANDRRRGELGAGGLLRGAGVYVLQRPARLRGRVPNPGDGGRGRELGADHSTGGELP